MPVKWLVMRLLYLLRKTQVLLRVHRFYIIIHAFVLYFTSRSFDFLFLSTFSHITLIFFYFTLEKTNRHASTYHYNVTNAK